MIHQQDAVDEDNNNPVAPTAANNDVKRSVPTKDADSNAAAAADDTDAADADAVQVQPPTPEKAGARYVLHHKSRGGGGVGAIGSWSKVANPVLERETLEGNSVKKAVSQVVYIKTHNEDDGDDLDESEERVGEYDVDDDDDDGSDDVVVDELNVASVLGRDYKLNRKRVHIETPIPAFQTRSI